MNNFLLYQKKNLKVFYILSFILCFNFSWGQQVIGSFPSMNGGFEGQTSNPATAATISLATNAWTSSHSTGAGVLSNTGGRSGPKFVTYTQTGTSHRRLQSPTADMPLGPYRVQFWYQGDLDGTTNAITDNLRGGGSSNGSSGATYSAYTKVSNTNSVTDTWTLYEGTFTTSTNYTSSLGLGIVSVNNAAKFKIDDFVIYEGATADKVAPDSPTSPSITNVTATSQTVSWFQPGTGIDGGGYMVVRSTSDPSTAPNANGIYSVGNSIVGDEKVVYLGTNLTFTDTFSTATNYYYRIYTVDKAFNYCAAPAKVNNNSLVTTLASLPSSQASNITFSSVTSSSFTINFTAVGGTNSLVVMSSSPINADPVNGVTYTTSANIAGGTKVVYNGAGNSVSLTGLSKGIYYVKVYTFNGSAGAENYLTTSPPSKSQVIIAEITSSTTGDWGTATTWSGNAVPTQYDNVTITAGHTVDISTTSTKCYNLTIPANSTVWSPSGKTLQVYGTSLQCNGTFGNTSSDLTTVSGSQLTVEFGENLTISGTGGIYPYKLRPVAGLTNIGVTFDANTDITASSGTGILSNTDVSNGNDNITYTINIGKTLTVRSNWATTSSVNTASVGNTTININGTCSITGAFATPVVYGKTSTVNINGTLNGGTSCSLFGYTSNGVTGGVTTYNVNGLLTVSGNLNVTPIEATVAPVINVGSSGVITVNGVADFSSTTLTGYIGNAPSTTGGTFILGALGTIKFANASGLETSAGPIRTTNHTFNTGANYNFVGTSAQVPGSDFPATVGNMTINNAAGVTLGTSTTVSGILNLTSGTLSTGGNLTLASNSTIIRSAGSLSAAPTFGASVNITYNGATAISSGLEIPNATSFSTVLNNLTIATTFVSPDTVPAVVTLANDTNLNNKLTVTSGSLNSAGKLTLKSAECCTAFVGQLATGAVTGDVTVERYIPAKRAWRALTAPVIRATNNSIFTNWQNGGTSGTSTGTGIEIWSNNSSNSSVTTGGSGSSMLTYSSSGNSWSGITDTTNTPLFSSTLNSPFMVFVTGPYASTSTNITSGAAATTLKATGSLIIGTKTYATTGSQYTFIGNPYASPLSLTAMLADTDNSTNFGNGIWIWDSNGNASVGSYNYFDKSASAYSYNASSTPAATPISATAEIQSGQSFFVQSATGTDATFSIKETHKGSTFSNAVFRDAAPAQLLRVGLYKQTNTEWSGRDGAMTVILNDADANQTPNKMANGTENVAFTKNGLLFASNHHLPLVASDVLNVKVWNTTAGANYKLKINTEQFATTSLNATLEDLFTNSRTPLTLDGTAVEYPFAVTTEAASTGNRFRIVFETNALGINNPKATGITILQNPITGDTFQLNLGTPGMGSYSYSICNTLGQEVEKGSINNVTQNTNYTVKFKNTTAAGMYIMKVTGSDNTAFTAKLIKK